MKTIILLRSGHSTAFVTDAEDVADERIQAELQWLYELCTDQIGSRNPANWLFYLNNGCS